MSRESRTYKNDEIPVPIPVYRFPTEKDCQGYSAPLDAIPMKKDRDSGFLRCHCRLLLLIAHNGQNNWS